jgi:hypothetical protein
LAVLTAATLAAAPAAAQVVTADYKFAPSVNSKIGSFTSEVWARVYRPTFTGTNRYPVILLMHGAHNTCGKNNTTPRLDDNDDYANTGTCPAGYSVVKSHEGYAYLANDLASKGYIVVSINANRGMSGTPADDGAMMKARGRLALWHLRMLSRWDRGVEATPASLGASFQNRIDIGEIGLMGHSRGAVGMRSALADYANPNTGWKNEAPGARFRGLLELSPPHEPGGETQIADPFNLPFLHLVGLCDGELSTYAEQSVVNPTYDRLLYSGGSETGVNFKAAYGIYGANHRYFNTEWQKNDSPNGCVNQTPLFTGAATETGSQSQRDAALTAVRNFFTATTGAGRDPAAMRPFDPVYAAPSGPTIARSFSMSATYANSSHLEAFDNPTGINSNWVPNDQSQLVAYDHYRGPREHDTNYPYARIEWATNSASTYLQTNFMSAGTGNDMTGYPYLEFRAEGTMNPQIAFSIRLVNGNGTLSGSVASSTYGSLLATPGTIGTGDANQPATYLHPPMRTFRIPLSAFSGATVSSLRGVRFVFDRASQCTAANHCSIELASIVMTAESNLAKLRPVAVSSVQDNNAALGGAKAVDGNTGSRWSSAASDVQWIRTDLVWSQTIRTVVLRWEAAYGKDFKIQVSDDASTWTDAMTVTGGTGGTQILRLPSPATGRYVRMLGSKRGTQYGYSLYELEVYGH